MNKYRLLLIISLIGLGILTWYYSQRQKMVVFCDVGQGDGALIIEGNFQMIIDAGPANGKMGECLSRYMPFFDKEIEAAVISHWDSDHAGGLTEIQQYYRIDKVYSGTGPNDDVEQINYTSNLVGGDIVDMGILQFEVKLPLSESDMEIRESNENSLAGVLKYGIYEILFLGDATGEEERRLVWRKLLDSQNVSKSVNQKRILKVSHHASAEATTEELLELWRPKAAVISVGAKNKFGHPTKEVVERLKKYGVEIRRTDTEGDILVKLDN